VLFVWRIPRIWKKRNVKWQSLKYCGERNSIWRLTLLKAAVATWWEEEASDRLKLNDLFCPSISAGWLTWPLAMEATWACREEVAERQQEKQLKMHASNACVEARVWRACSLYSLEKSERLCLERCFYSERWSFCVLYSTDTTRETEEKLSMTVSQRGSGSQVYSGSYICESILCSLWREKF